MNKEQAIERIIEGILNNPLFTPIPLWLYLVKKMNYSELQSLLKVLNRGQFKVKPQGDLYVLQRIADKYIPMNKINRIIVVGKVLHDEDYIYIGLN